MGLIILFIIIISLNWIFHLFIVFIPTYLLDLIGQAFGITMGIIALSFLVWCFDE